MQQTAGAARGQCCRTNMPHLLRDLGAEALAVAQAGPCGVALRLHPGIPLLHPPALKQGCGQV